MVTGRAGSPETVFLLPWSPLAGLSTIEQQTYEIGFSAMTCMLSRLQGDQCPPREVLLPGKLIVRHSTQGKEARQGGH